MSDSDRGKLPLLAPTPLIDGYLVYLRDVRRMSANTLESYARDLALLAEFADKRETSVDALQRQDLEAFVRQLMSVGPGAAIGRARRSPACAGSIGSSRSEQKQDSSPADDLQPPRAWAALPKFLRSRKSTVCSSSPTPARRADCATRR